MISRRETVLHASILAVAAFVFPVLLYGVFNYLNVSGGFVFILTWVFPYLLGGLLIGRIVALRIGFFIMVVAMFAVNLGMAIFFTPIECGTWSGISFYGLFVAMVSSGVIRYVKRIGQRTNLKLFIGGLLYLIVAWCVAGVLLALLNVILYKDSMDLVRKFL